MSEQEKGKIATRRQGDDTPRGMAIVLIAIALLICTGFVMRQGRTVLREDAAALSDPATYNILIDLNTADAAHLHLLPNVGPVLAERIVADRIENGPFQSLDDLMRVHGVGRVTIERVAPYVIVNP